LSVVGSQLLGGNLRFDYPLYPSMSRLSGEPLRPFQMQMGTVGLDFVKAKPSI